MLCPALQPPLITTAALSGLYRTPVPILSQTQLETEPVSTRRESGAGMTSDSIPSTGARSEPRGLAYLAVNIRVCTGSSLHTGGGEHVFRSSAHTCGVTRATYTYRSLQPCNCFLALTRTLAPFPIVHHVSSKSNFTGLRRNLFSSRRQVHNAHISTSVHLEKNVTE